jgi:periplasmic protein TonB
MTASSPSISPIAAATSALLHAVIVVALLPIALPQEARMTERLVEITLDLPSPPVDAPALAAATDQAARNIAPGSDAAEQSTPKQDEPQPASVPTPVPTEPDVALMLPSSEPPPTPTARDFGSSASPPAPEPNWEKILPPLQAPSPITGQDFARSAPPATASSRNVQPQTRAPGPQQPIREARPKRAAQQQVAEGTEGKAQETPSPLTKAATDYSHRQAQQDYLWNIIRKLSQYHFYGNPQDESERGLVVARLIVARDGRLIDAAVAKSSGFPGLDRAVLDTVRRASPFPPLPADLAADSYTFIVPINYTQQR